VAPDLLTTRIEDIEGRKGPVPACESRSITGHSPKKKADVVLHRASGTPLVYCCDLCVPYFKKLYSGGTQT
jgi:hypothetical protein